MRKGSAVTLRGFCRVALREDDEIVGDSGFIENTVVNEGFEDYLGNLLAGAAGSKQISRMGLGTGGAPATGDTALAGDITAIHTDFTRQNATFSNSTANAAVTARFTATWASSDSHISTSVALSNIAILNTPTTGGTIMAGAAFTSSAWNTNQDINATYEIRFS